MDAGDNTVDAETMIMLKHDIKNQLSNITLVLEQLKHEAPNAGADYFEYLEMISLSAKKIDDLLKSTD
jgi:hypothetical protein